MHDYRTFEDISIIHSGLSSCRCLIPEFKLAMNYKMHTEIIPWETLQNDSDRIQFSNSGTKLCKKNNSSWISPICSAKPIEKTTYIEMKINNLGEKPVDSVGKIIIGFSAGNTTRYLERKSMVLIRNDKTSSSIGTTYLYKSCDAGTGDVMGFMVDFEHDRILFYINTKLVAEGKLMPSKMQRIYMILWFHNKNCELEMGHFHSFRQLEQYNKTKSL